MVALNESFASEYPSLGSKNRVGDFFAHEAKSCRANRLPAQQPRREKAYGYDKTASGMFFYGFRYYDPVTGRWPSRDPIGEWGGLNIYTFSRNNPIDLWDYLGMCADCSGNYTTCKNNADAVYGSCVTSAADTIGTWAERLKAIENLAYRAAKGLISFRLRNDLAICMSLAFIRGPVKLCQRLARVAGQIEGVKRKI